MPKGIAVSYPEAVLAFIQRNATMPRHELTNLVNQEFGTAYTQAQITGLCTRKGWLTGRTGQFHKGMTTWNKGKKGLCVSPASTFKKGHIPHNARPVGHERIDTKDGYIYVKVDGLRTMVLKHRHVWEQANGPVPEGHVVVFRDGNRMNCSLDNLLLVKRGVLAVMNKRYSHEPNPNYTPLYLNMARIDHRVAELRNKP